MTPERILAWVRKPAGGTKRLLLTVETEDGFEQLAEWDRASIDEETEEIATSIVTVSQEHAEAAGEEVKFRFRWMGTKSRPIKSIAHWCRPKSKTKVHSTTEEEKSVLLTMNEKLMDHLDKKEKRDIEQSSIITEVYKKTIEMQSAQLEGAHKLLRKFAEEAEEVETAPTAAELTSEQKEEISQRGRAMGALADQITPVFELALATLANKYLPEVPGEKPPDVQATVTDIKDAPNETKKKKEAKPK